MTDGATPLDALRDSVDALARLAAVQHSETARAAADRLIADIEVALREAGSGRGAGAPRREPSFRTDTLDTFRIDLRVESCPRCTQRSFKPQAPTPGEADVRYVCSSCGYRARLELADR
jgi:hypothetical protein